jgi:IS5 family transposase
VVIGVKASSSPPIRAPNGQFALHAKVLPGNPYDGHTLSGVVDTTEKLTGSAIEDAYVDKGNRGHATANPHSIFISGQRRSFCRSRGNWR